MKPFHERWVAFWKGWKKNGGYCPTCGPMTMKQNTLRCHYKPKGRFHCVRCGNEYVLRFVMN